MKMVEGSTVRHGQGVDCWVTMGCGGAQGGIGDGEDMEGGGQE